MIEHFNRAVDSLNQVNGGVPLGFSTLDQAAEAARPSPEAWEARNMVG